MTPEQVRELLQAEESDRLERKTSFSDSDAIRDTFIQFANDLAGRGGGYLIVGQGPDKSIPGLTVSDDEAQQKLAAIARTRCQPAIPGARAYRDSFPVLARWWFRVTGFLRLIPRVIIAWCKDLVRSMRPSEIALIVVATLSVLLAIWATSFLFQASKPF